MGKLKSQQMAAGTPMDRAYPQLTVDQKSPNGVPVERALGCAIAASETGFTRISLWFAPQRIEDATAFLAAHRETSDER